VTPPLHGVRVIDFTEYIAGPYCTMMLADMGADVIKVERPDGDTWRHTAPIAPYESRVSMAVNRGKRSISIDMARPEAQDIVRKLVVGADVVVVNYRPGVAERLALDYETVSALNPGVIYCENTAFGREGPYAGRPGFDILSQATTGMVVYENKIERGTPTIITTFAVVDISTGLFMAFAIANALYVRAQSGQGQRIDTSLFASGLAVQTRPMFSVEELDGPVREGFLGELAARRKEGISYEEAAKLHRSYIPGRGRNNYYRVYETRDGLIAVACLNNRQRRALRDALGIADATVDGMTYDWFSEAVRQAHRDTTVVIEEKFREKATAEWIAAFDAADVPCAPAHFPEELFDNPHVAANDLLLRLDHPVAGPVRMPRNPVRMSATPPTDPTPSPTLGQHTAEVMAELGYGEGEVEALFDAGVLWDRERRMAARENPVP
jgi:crotonobetainyl-CoA:carnitine CoA-transferase CaiB-like acyl-CoA transferase